METQHVGITLSVILTVFYQRDLESDFNIIFYWNYTHCNKFKTTKLQCIIMHKPRYTNLHRSSRTLNGCEDQIKFQK